MSVSQVHPAGRLRRQRAFTRLGVISALVLGAAVVADLVYADGSYLAAVLVIGLCVVGVAACLIAVPDNGGRSDSEGRVGDWG
jgi:hypothetical protein